MGDDRTFDWTIVEDDTAGDTDDDTDDVEGGLRNDTAGAFDTDDDNDPVDEPRRARNARRLLVACVLGGVVILALGVIGTRVLLSELDRPSGHQRLVTSIHDRYQQTFDTCAGRGGDSGACAIRAAEACADDSRWTLSDAAEARDVCTFGKAD